MLNGSRHDSLAEERIIRRITFSRVKYSMKGLPAQIKHYGKDPSIVKQSIFPCKVEDSSEEFLQTKKGF